MQREFHNRPEQEEKITLQGTTAQQAEVMLQIQNFLNFMFIMITTLSYNLTSYWKQTPDSVVDPHS